MHATACVDLVKHGVNAVHDQFAVKIDRATERAVGADLDLGVRNTLGLHSLGINGARSQGAGSGQSRDSRDEFHMKSFLSTNRDVTKQLGA